MSSNLDKMESLAKASKLHRFVHSPIRYALGILHRMLIYPYTRKGKLVETTTFFGTKMKVMLPSGMDLFLLGGKSHDSEIRLARFILSTLGEGDTFLDVGAHYGYFSLLASSIVGDDGGVVSIEASKSTFSILAQNLKDKKNITPFNIAISAKREALNFYEYPLIYSEYNSLNADQYEDSKWAKNIEPNVIIIEAYRLDEFVKEENIIPDFIKIDVEGVEDQVITGMQAILESDRSPIIAMEYIVHEEEDSPHDRAIRLLLDYGYACHRILPDGSVESIQKTELKSYLDNCKLESDNIIFIKP